MVEGTDPEVTFCMPHLVKWSNVENVLFITHVGKTCILIFTFEKMSFVRYKIHYNTNWKPILKFHLF